LPKQESVSFRKILTVGQETTMKEFIKDDGTIEGLRVRFNQGQQGSLLVRPYIEVKGGSIIDLVTYQQDSDQYLSGDDDKFEFDISLPVGRNDQICVYAKNNSATYGRTVVVDIIVDYYGGQNRVV